MLLPEAIERIAVLEAENDRLRSAIASLHRDVARARAAVTSVEKERDSAAAESSKVIELLKTTVLLERTRAERAEAQLAELTAAKAPQAAPGFSDSDDLPDTVDAR